MGGFTNSGGSVIVNPSAALTSDRYSQSGGSTDVSGILSTPSYKQSGGDTIIESVGTISATTFKATGGTVTVNGTLDRTAVEIGSGATFQGTGKIVGNVSMGGTIILGGLGVPGTVTIFGNYEQTGNGILRAFISSSSNGLLSVSADVALDSDSILSITFNGFNPIGDTFTIMDYASLVGQVSNGKPSTVAGYETVWRIYLAPYLQEITLRDFRTSDEANLFIEIIYRQLGIGRTTLQHCKRRLSVGPQSRGI